MKTDPMIILIARDTGPAKSRLFPIICPVCKQPIYRKISKGRFHPQCEKGNKA